jgi:uncharacterized protein (TIGR02117 family)
MSIALLLLALALTGCLGPVEGLHPPAPHAPSRMVWVVGHGWHTSLVLASADIPDDLWPEREDFGAARFLEVAWGDRDFYRAPQETLGLALRAAVASKGSVLHVVGFTAPVASYFAGREILPLSLSRPGYDALVRFIDAAHARDGTRAPRLGPGLHGHSAFYASGVRYGLWRTCNTWVATALRTAGCPITPLWAATAGGLLAQVRPLARVPPPAL